MALQDVFTAVTISTDTTADMHGVPQYVFSLWGDDVLLAQANQKEALLLLQDFWTQAQYDDGQ